MASLDQNDIGISVAVEVANTGIRGGLGNCFQRNNFKGTQFPRLEWLSLNPTALRGRGIQRKLHRNTHGKGHRDKYVIQKSAAHITRSKLMWYRRCSAPSRDGN